LADEPTTALDATEQVQIVILLRQGPRATESTRISGGVERRIAVKRSRNSLSLASTPGINIHCPSRPRIYISNAPRNSLSDRPPARAASRGLCVGPKLS
jgi:hypothetical protein